MSCVPISQVRILDFYLTAPPLSFTFCPQHPLADGVMSVSPNQRRSYILDLCH